MSVIKAQEVLNKLDGKTFGFFHIKMIVVSPTDDNYITSTE